MQLNIQFDSNFKVQHIRHSGKFDKALVEEKKLLSISKLNQSGAVPQNIYKGEASSVNTHSLAVQIPLLK